jgi:hypothetical protein
MDIFREVAKAAKNEVNRKSARQHSQLVAALRKKAANIYLRVIQPDDGTRRRIPKNGGSLPRNRYGIEATCQRGNGNVPIGSL